MTNPGASSHGCKNQPVISAAVKHMAISVSAFLALSDPCTELASIDCANSRRIVPGSAFCRIGGAHHIAVVGDRVLALEHLENDRTRGHEGDEVAEERTVAVDGVERLGIRLRPEDPLLSDDAQTRIFDHRIDPAREVAPGCIRLDDRQRALGRHGGPPVALSRALIARVPSMKQAPAEDSAGAALPPHRVGC